MKKLLLSTALFAAASPALAATTATVATDLNLRSGPSSTYTSVGVMPAGAEVMVSGCQEANDWCSVEYDGMTGWAYAPYLAVQSGEEYVSVAARPVDIEVDTITYTTKEEENEQGAAVAATATIGALAAYALGGPATVIMTSGLFSGFAGAVLAEPEETTLAYIRAHPVEPIYLEGEVAVGATVPDVVATYEVPDNQELRYLMVNDELVLINGDSQIVYID